MRVDAYNKVSQLYHTNNTKQTAKPGSSSKTDKLEISQIGKDYQVAKQAVAAADDVRMDKVEELKRQMQTGTYNVSAKEVADRMVDNYFNTII